MEEQVTGTRLNGTVRGCVYNPYYIDSEDSATVEVHLDHGTLVRIPMLVTEASKVRRGDSITVTVEITREP